MKFPALERSIPQNNAFHALRAEYSHFQVNDGFQRLAHRGGWVRIERITFRLDRSTYSCIRPCRVTLRDEAACSCCLRGDNEIVGPLCSQTVSQLELPIELADVEALGDSGELVHDHIRVRFAKCSHHCVRIENVEHLGFRAHQPQPLRLGERSRYSDYLMAGLHEKWNKSPSDNSRCSCYKNPHNNS